MIKVVKIGGNVIDNSEALDSFLKDFAHLTGSKILVHGGGKEATRLSREMGIETTMIDGRRVTDRATLDVVTMVYAGLINKRIVAKLQALGVNALGVTGADANLIPATRRPANPVDFGFVGDINTDFVGSETLGNLLDAGLTPVFCAICHDGNGSLLNCNADTVAASVAIGAARIGETTLTYCFEKPGVMADVDDDNSVIPLITNADFDGLRARNVVAKGMIPKLSTALQAAKKGVSSVRICQAENLLGDTGTVIKYD